jgi:hypothetical protein
MYDGWMLVMPSDPVELTSSPTVLAAAMSADPQRVDDMNGIHPAASNHLPAFITAPGETDVLMVVMAIILLLFVLMVGVLYFRLHALPERFADQKVQFEIVCVLALLAMFTHKHIFWIAGLLLALIDFPDLGGLLRRIAGSTGKIAAKESGMGADEIAAGATTISQEREMSPKVEGAITKMRSVSSRS